MKDKEISIRVSASEHQQVKSLAQQKNTTVTNLIRRSLKLPLSN
jgi:hypothetical protein